MPSPKPPICRSCATTRSNSVKTTSRQLHRAGPYRHRLRTRALRKPGPSRKTRGGFPAWPARPARRNRGHGGYVGIPMSSYITGQTLFVDRRHGNPRLIFIASMYLRSKSACLRRDAVTVARGGKVVPKGAVLGATIVPEGYRIIATRNRQANSGVAMWLYSMARIASLSFLTSPSIWVVKTVLTKSAFRPETGCVRTIG